MANKKLGLGGGAGLVRRSGRSSLAGRFGNRPSGDSEALERLQAGRSGALTTRVGKVEVEREAERAELARLGMERLFEKKMEEVIGEYRVRLAVVMDFTYSTTDDIQTFISNIERIHAEFNDRFSSLQLLPVTSGGNGVYVGEVDDLEFFDRARNVEHTYKSPIGPGMKGVVSGDFFKNRLLDRGGDTRLDALVYFSDEFFEEGFGYSRSVVPYLREHEVVVAGLVSRADQEAYDSHERSVVDNFGKKGIVVIREQSEMDPVEVVIEFLMNQAQNKARPVAAARMPKTTQVSPSLQRSLRFSDHLKLKGKNAGQVLQGRERARLTG
jgi:hypothetical protein